MEPSSDRLDDLVARARALFEKQHGPSEGCFAAFSPAKVNLMGDFIEGSGGLALQMSLDRRVVVFGRGRVVPEKKSQKKRNSPPGGASRKPTAKRFPGEGRDVGRLSGASVHSYGGESHRDSGSVGAVQSRHSIGDGGSRHSVGNGSHHSGGREMAGDYSRKPMIKWPKNRPKTSGRGMDSIVQDLVFGHRGRARASTISSKEVTGSWLKDRRLLGFLKNEKGSRSGSGRSNGVDGRDISGGGGNRSESSTPTTRYDSNSSAHSVHMSILKPVDASGDATASSVDRSIVTAVGVDGTMDASEPTVTSLKSALIQEDGGFSADSGSTTTEESFPGDSSREEDYGSEGVAGVGIGGGVTMLPNGRRISVDSLTTDASLSVTDVGEKVVSSASKSVFTEADGALAVTAGDAAPVPVTTVESNNEDRDSEPSLLPPPLLISDSVDAPGEVGNGMTGRVSPEGGDGGGEAGAGDEAELPRSEGSDPALARDLDEAAQAKAEIEAAEAADREAARLRTSRVFCEACPQDGMVEFMANRGMRGGGDSWKGLVTAVAAEYAQELAAGMVMGIEAVVVSDLPGTARAVTPALESSEQQEQQQLRQSCHGNPASDLRALVLLVHVGGRSLPVSHQSWRRWCRSCQGCTGAVSRKGGAEARWERSWLSWIPQE